MSPSRASDAVPVAKGIDALIERARLDAELERSMPVARDALACALPETCALAMAEAGEWPCRSCHVDATLLRHGLSR